MSPGVPVTKATIAALACAIVMLPAVSARADPYDDCILAHVPSASQDRTALREIKTACANSTSVDIPSGKGELSVRPDTQPLSPGVWHVLVAAFTVTNDTGYRITAIVIHVAGSNGDRRTTFIDRGATERLTIDLDTMDDYRWWQSHTVTVTATKGIPRSGGWWPFK